LDGATTTSPGACMNQDALNCEWKSPPPTAAPQQQRITIGQVNMPPER
jgi:hypothetical protein